MTVSFQAIKDSRGSFVNTMNEIELKSFDDK